jgi:hypothetical protein
MKNIPITGTVELMIVALFNVKKAINELWSHEMRFKDERSTFDSLVFF